MQEMDVFSRSEVTLKEGVSVGPTVGPSVGSYVMLSLFGLLGATNAVHTALFIKEMML